MPVPGAVALNTQASGRFLLRGRVAPSLCADQKLFIRSETCRRSSSDMLFLPRRGCVSSVRLSREAMIFVSLCLSAWSSTSAFQKSMLVPAYPGIRVR